MQNKIFLKSSNEYKITAFIASGFVFISKSILDLGIEVNRFSLTACNVITLRNYRNQSGPFY